MQTTDVLVVGAGLAGLRTARALARLGLGVTLTDRKSSPADGVRTTGIFVRRSLEDFAFSFGVLGARPSRASCCGRRRGGRPRCTVGAAEFRIGRMGRLYESELQAAVDAGVDWQPQHEFVGIEFLRSSMLAEFATADGPRLVRARYLVGADGCRSKVAQQLRLDLESKVDRSRRGRHRRGEAGGAGAASLLGRPAHRPRLHRLDGVGPGGTPRRRRGLAGERSSPIGRCGRRKEFMTRVLRKAEVLSDVADLSHIWGRRASAGTDPRRWRAVLHRQSARPAGGGCCRCRFSFDRRRAGRVSAHGSGRGGLCGALPLDGRPRSLAPYDGRTDPGAVRFATGAAPRVRFGSLGVRGRSPAVRDAYARRPRG